MRFPCLAVLVAVPLLAASAGTASAAALCRPGQDDASEREAPASLLPRLARLFNVPADTVQANSAIRCADGVLLACTVGANLSCGRADTSRRSEGASDFCRDNPGSDTVPLAATGHDTVYTWHCAGARAVAGNPVTATDRHGFIARNWVKVP